MSYAIWNPLTTYLVGDTVSYIGVIYGAILVNTNVIPLGNPLTWVVLGGGGGGGGGATYTFSSSGTGVSLVSLLSSSTDFKTVSLLAGSGITLTPNVGGADLTISASGAGLGNMNYVGAGTAVGQHYIANDTTGLNATNSSMIETAPLITFNKNLAVGTFKISQNPVALGSSAGTSGQSTGAVAIGNLAGQTNQSANSVAVGNTCANFNQGANSVAVGVNAGNTSQGGSCVAVGSSAGASAQGVTSVAIGSSAGNTSQGASSVAIGGGAGQTSQGSSCVAIGSTAGNSGQLAGAVSIGVNSGNAIQGVNAIAIGRSAGASSQGASSVAIGAFAGQTTAVANSIILNATGGALNAPTTGVYVAPVRPLSTQTPLGTLKYSTANEVYYDSTALGLGMNYVGPATVVGQHYIANDTTGLNANQSALVEDAEKINFNGERIYMPNPTTFAGANYMLKMRGISNVSYEQYGIHIEGMTAANSAYGIYAQQLDGDSTIGMLLDDIHAKNDSTGFFGASIRSDIAQATGMYFQSILGETDCQGLQMTTITSNNGNSYGIRLDTINSPNAYAYGISLNGVKATIDSYGLFIDDIRAKENSFGFRVSKVFSDTKEAIGGYIVDVGADLKDSFGLVIQAIGNATSGAKSGNGALISKIVSGLDPTDEACAVRIQDVTGSVGYGVKAMGIISAQQSYFTHSLDMSAKSIYGHWLETLTGDTEVFGTFFQKLQANTAVSAHYFEKLTSQSRCFGVYGQEIQGKGESSGLRLITVNSDSGKSYGTYIEEVTASSDAYGHLTQTINSSSASAHGIRVDGIQGAINAEGFATKGVSAKTGLAYGARIESVYTDGKEDYGVYIDGVDAPVGNAYGVLLQNITGSRQYGFYQRGALNVGNIFDSFIDCGGSTANTDPPAVNVRGSINTETQFFTTATATATINGGNILICSGVTITTLNLPASPPDGLTYQLWKPSTLTLTINGGVHLINGSATQSIAGGSPANPSNASLTYSANLAQWLYHLN